MKICCFSIFGREYFSCHRMKDLSGNAIFLSMCYDAHLKGKYRFVRALLDIKKRMHNKAPSKLLSLHLQKSLFKAYLAKLVRLLVLLTERTWKTKREFFFFSLKHRFSIYARLNWALSRSNFLCKNKTPYWVVSNLKCWIIFEKA